MAGRRERERPVVRAGEARPLRVLNAYVHVQFYAGLGMAREHAFVCSLHIVYTRQPKEGSSAHAGCADRGHGLSRWVKQWLTNSRSGFEMFLLTNSHTKSLGIERGEVQARGLALGNQLGHRQAARRGIEDAPARVARANIGRTLHPWHAAHDWHAVEGHRQVAALRGVMVMQKSEKTDDGLEVRDTE